MNSAMNAELEKLRKNGKDWEKMATDVPGLFVIRAPGPKSNPTEGKLMVEINPVDESGNPKKFKGLMISDRQSFAEMLEIMNNDKVYKVLSMVEETNPAPAAKAGGKQLTKLKLD